MGFDDRVHVRKQESRAKDSSVRNQDCRAIKNESRPGFKSQSFY